MKLLSRILFNCSALLMIPAAASAAGTYYTGNYQSPQSRYTQKSYSMQRPATYSNQGVSAYNRQQYSNAGYSTTGYNANARYNQNARSGAQMSGQGQQQVAAVQSGGQNGFSLNAGVSKQSAMWQFEMNSAKSKLHYDNIDWLVLGADGKYVFEVGNTKMQVNAGIQYGMQTGESSMVDDDISHGGYLYGTYVNPDTDETVGSMFGHSLSVGTSKDGDMFGFNAGFGLTDFFKLGRIKITPSIGWRYFKYNLETSGNYGISTVNGDWDNSCLAFDGGEVQCWPLLAGYTDITGKPTIPGYTYFDSNGNQIEIDANGNLSADPSYVAVDVGTFNYMEALGTFYFEQPDVSHSYEVEWSGPYLALDMSYEINPDNMVSGFVEFGLPSYTATGDQPYRIDWAHPKSVEDKGGIGSAFHFGMGANWMTMLTDNIGLSIGLTYDYYTVSDADATTYFNSEYYQDIYDAILSSWQSEFPDADVAEVEDWMLNGVEFDDGTKYSANAEAVFINDIRANGWKDKASSEIESFYKSLGIRVGLNARF